jgi:uncharacterized phage protein (TIGR02218 family)
MKALSEDLQIHLESGATTMCHCWRLMRNDDTELGFTDHDQDLQFDGLTFEAAAGFTASAVSSSSGLSVDNLDVLGALTSSHLADAELAAGLFDNAEIEIWRVNWMEPEQRILLRKGNLGEVQRGSQGFAAEVRGLSHRLNQSTGRLFQYACDADLGGARCGVALAPGAYAAAGTVLTVEGGALLKVNGLSGYASGWFARGLLTFSTGSNSGEVLEVKSHERSNGQVILSLWHEPARPVEVGDSFSITAGCDKQFVTCKEKFANAAQFRGFPHMPGNDFALSYARRDGRNDGGSQR